MISLGIFVVTVLDFTACDLITNQNILYTNVTTSKITLLSLLYSKLMI